jgi:hypothetical protein
MEAPDENIVKTVNFPTKRILKYNSLQKLPNKISPIKSRVKGNLLNLSR